MPIIKKTEARIHRRERKANLMQVFLLFKSQRTLPAREISQLFYLGRLCGEKQVFNLGI